VAGHCTDLREIPSDSTLTRTARSETLTVKNGES
jgi:hypothetical protein